MMTFFVTFACKCSFLVIIIIIIIIIVTKDLKCVLTLMGLWRQAERARAIGALRLARHEGMTDARWGTLRTWRTDPEMRLEQALLLEETFVLCTITAVGT